MNLSHAPSQLVELLMRDPSVNVRASVAFALSVIKDRDTIPQLIRFASDKSQNIYGRRNAVGALGDMRAVEAAEILDRLAEDEDVAYFAAKAWSQITRTRHQKLPRSVELESDREYPDGRTPWAFEKDFKERQLRDRSLVVARPVVPEKPVVLFHMDQERLRLLIEARLRIGPESALGSTEPSQSIGPSSSSDRSRWEEEPLQP
jgi:uncharacterized protein (UPF0147 family)